MVITNDHGLYAHIHVNIVYIGHCAAAALHLDNHSAAVCFDNSIETRRHSDKQMPLYCMQYDSVRYTVSQYNIYYMVRFVRMQNSSIESSATKLYSHRSDGWLTIVCVLGVDHHRQPSSSTIVNIQMIIIWSLLQNTFR